MTWEAAKAKVLDGFESYDGVDGDGSVDALIAAGDEMAAMLDSTYATLGAVAQEAQRRGISLEVLVNAASGAAVGGDPE